MRLTFLLATAAALVLSLGLASAAEQASSSAAPKRAAPGCGAATGACAFGSAPGVCEGVATQCAEKGCAAHAGDLKGDVLVLDVGSLKPAASNIANIANPAQCCDACSKYEDCEGWVFCTKPEGCGWGCTRYTDMHGRLAPSFPYKLGDDTPLPITGQGPFGLGCLSDRWPAGMCTLKTRVDAADVAALRAGTAPADHYWGWVSGLRKPGGGGLVADRAAASMKAPPQAGGAVGAAAGAPKAAAKAPVSKPVE